MFKKLLANINFNPSLIEEISEYLPKLKREVSSRYISFIMLVLSTSIQLYAFVTTTDEPLKVINEKLPEISPGIAISIMVLLTILSGYFLVRNKLLSRELTILKRDRTKTDGGHI